jgi:hypothetical protein
LTYQWFFNGGEVPSATSSIYSVLSASSVYAGSYCVVVANGAGAITSAPAILSVNNVPVLASVADQSVHPGATLLITNVASDLDLPAQQLTFSLDPGAPAGASTDPTTGVFRWSPSAAQADTTNQITLRVLDSGVPPLTQAIDFRVTVTPPLRITSTATTNGEVQIRWQGIPSHTYRLECKETLSVGDWVPLAPDVVCSGNAGLFAEPASANRRYYRLLEVR